MAVCFCINVGLMGANWDEVAFGFFVPTVPTGSFFAVKIIRKLKNS